MKKPLIDLKINRLKPKDKAYKNVGYMVSNFSFKFLYLLPLLALSGCSQDANANQTSEKIAPTTDEWHTPWNEDFRTNVEIKGDPVDFINPKLDYSGQEKEEAIKNSHVSYELYDNGRKVKFKCLNGWVPVTAAVALHHVNWYKSNLPVNTRTRADSIYFKIDECSKTKTITYSSIYISTPIDMGLNNDAFGDTSFACVPLEQKNQYDDSGFSYLGAEGPLSIHNYRLQYQGLNNAMNYNTTVDAINAILKVIPKSDYNLLFDNIVRLHCRTQDGVVGSLDLRTDMALRTVGYNNGDIVDPSRVIGYLGAYTGHNLKLMQSAAQLGIDQKLIMIIFNQVNNTPY